MSSIIVDTCAALHTMSNVSCLSCKGNSHNIIYERLEKEPETYREIIWEARFMLYRIFKCLFTNDKVV